MNFYPDPTITSTTLLIRPLAEDDFEALSLKT